MEKENMSENEGADQDNEQKKSDHNQVEKSEHAAEHEAPKNKSDGDIENIDEGIVKSKGDRAMIYALIVIALAFVLIFTLPNLIDNDNFISLDELHERNLAGKLSPDEGFIYEGVYSFVYFNDLWYTRLSNEAGTQEFNIPFHYRPDEVDDIDPIGTLNHSNLEAYKNFFMTFDPLDDHLSYIGVAIGETSFVIVQVFGKGVIGSCTNNEVEGCLDRPKVECNSTDAPVFYYASEQETNLLYMNNCVIVAGQQEELIRATDRMLFDLLGIM